MPPRKKAQKGDGALNTLDRCSVVREDVEIGKGTGMARLARVVVPGVPHHLTQRGNRCQDVFFSDADRRKFLSFLAE